MANKIAQRWGDRHVIVIGDSTGNNKKDVAADKTNYEIFEEILGMGSTEKFTNPPVQSRIIGANSNFYHKKVIVDPSCLTLIKDLELVAYKEDGSDIDKSNIDLTHAADAFTYGLWYFLPIKKKPRETRTIFI